MYTVGRYWIKTTEHDQALFALVTEYSDYDLLLTDVRMVPEGPVVYERLIVGRAAVSEARPVDPPSLGNEEPTPASGPRRIHVKG